MFYHLISWICWVFPDTYSERVSLYLWQATLSSLNMSLYKEVVFRLLQQYGTCVFVWERGREREREGEGERGREGERERGRVYINWGTQFLVFLPASSYKYEKHQIDSSILMRLNNAVPHQHSVHKYIHHQMYLVKYNS